ncbi:LexA family transcriptional regulator [Streptomyces sp. NP-1717]|uniref:LexA family protein n=1 Tax=Streptomyces sp. NP-1717 TaxID=2704470 RepID=UPI001F5D6C22|nr:hypothetical protein [Streptomyces sp. NP-1717]MCI3220864.1 hypothetical protein [Streptomyces sp. NP-1717]
MHTAVNEVPTERQVQILRAIRGWIAEHGEGPSVREISALVGLSSTASVAYQLGRMEDLGMISRSARRWHSVRLGGLTRHGRRQVRLWRRSRTKPPGRRVVTAIPDTHLGWLSDGRQGVLSHGGPGPRAFPRAGPDSHRAGR